MRAQQAAWPAEKPPLVNSHKCPKPARQARPLVFRFSRERIRGEAGFVRGNAENDTRFSARQIATSRRSVLLGGLGLLTTGALPFLPASGDAVPPSEPGQTMLDPFIADVQKRTFRFFWDTTNPRNGLARDRFPSPSPSSIAAVGFALTAYPIGVERGYITREAARDRVLATLRFFHQAPQGPRAARHDRPQGVLLPLLGYGNGPALGRIRTVDGRYGALSCRNAVLSILL